ncbi:MAG: hypothetical protein J1E83_02680 [Lachnospiraceae bacterium]|nr:hypothetical protein [Lachnospiraceae bacterium]
MSMVNTNYGAGAVNTYTKNYAAKKTAETSFAEKAAEKAAVSTEDMTLEEYKVYFQQKMDSLYTHPSQRNYNPVIDITDAAYERMKNDPEYEQKVLNSFAVNKAVNFGNYIPVFSYMHIDDTWEKSYGYTQGMKENTPTSEKSSKGLGEWWEERHERFEELLEEQVKAVQKREQLQKELAQQAYLNKQLASLQKMQSFSAEKTQSVNGTSESRMTQASAAYEATIKLM